MMEVLLLQTCVPHPSRVKFVSRQNQSTELSREQSHVSTWNHLWSTEAPQTAACGR